VKSFRTERELYLKSEAGSGSCQRRAEWVLIGLSFNLGPELAKVLGGDPEHFVKQG